MNRLLSLAVLGVVSAALASAGCQNKDAYHHHDDARRADARDLTAADGTGEAVLAADADHAKRPAGQAVATARLEPSKAPGDDNVGGVVEFRPAVDGKGLVVHYEVRGLSADSKHGFHIHEKGDLSDPEFKSAGGHFNPDGHKHGGPAGDARHGGDLGNITADANGVAKGEVTAPGLTLDESKTGIVGRSVVVHEKADDLSTDPSGNSGARIAAGVIMLGGHASASESSSSSKAPHGEKDANNAAKQDNK